MNLKDLKTKMNSNYLIKLRINVYLTIDLEKIDDIYQSYQRIKNITIESLDKQKQKIELDQSLNQDEKNELIDQLSDDAYCAKETTELAGELVIIALYKTFEIAIKNALKVSKLFDEKNLRNTHIITVVENLLKTKNINVRKFKNFEAYDELRLINNSIKHSGHAREDLSKYKSFKLGEQLKDLYSHYERLKNPANQFIVELRESLLKAI